LLGMTVIAAPPPPMQPWLARQVPRLSPQALSDREMQLQQRMQALKKEVASRKQALHEASTALGFVPRSARSTASEGPETQRFRRSSSVSAADEVAEQQEPPPRAAWQDAATPNHGSLASGRASSSTSTYFPDGESQTAAAAESDCETGVSPAAWQESLRTRPPQGAGPAQVQWSMRFDDVAPRPSPAMRRRQSAPPPPPSGWGSVQALNSTESEDDGGEAAQQNLIERQNVGKPQTGSNMESSHLASPSSADVDVETAEWMAGLRGAKVEEEGVSDDPLVFGSGFKPPAKPPRRSSATIRKQATWSPSTHNEGTEQMGARSPPRIFRPDRSFSVGGDDVKTATCTTPSHPGPPSPTPSASCGFTGYAATAAAEKPHLDARREAARQEAQFRAVHERIRGGTTTSGGAGGAASAAPAAGPSPSSSGSARPEMRPRVKPFASSKDTQAKASSPKAAEPKPSPKPDAGRPGAANRAHSQTRAGEANAPRSPGGYHQQQQHRVPPTKPPGQTRPGATSHSRHNAAAGSRGGRPTPVCKGGVEKPGAQAGLLDTLKAEIVRLHKTPSKAERRRKFLQLCFQWHPDKNPSNAEFATKGFQLLQERKAALLSGS